MICRSLADAGIAPSPGTSTHATYATPWRRRGNHEVNRRIVVRISVWWARVSGLKEAIGFESLHLTGSARSSGTSSGRTRSCPGCTSSYPDHTKFYPDRTRYRTRSCPGHTRSRPVHTSSCPGVLLGQPELTPADPRCPMSQQRPLVKVFEACLGVPRSFCRSPYRNSTVYFFQTNEMFSSAGKRHTT